MEEDRTRKAYEILWTARENLLKFLVDEIIEKEGVLSGKTTYEGALGFEYQEIDNKYMGRLSSLNILLNNLMTNQTPPRRPPSPANKVEIVHSDKDGLISEVNNSLRRNSTLKLVGASMEKSEDNKVTVLLAFTSP